MAPQQRTRPGAVWLIKDEVLVWPEGRDKPRGHEHHRVILLQDEELCRPSMGPATVMVIPCSSSGTGGAARWDYLLPEGEEGFDKPRIIAYVSLIQPILKTDLNQYNGQVSKETLTELKARAQWIMSIQRMPARLPDRSTVQIPATESATTSALPEETSSQAEAPRVPEEALAAASSEEEQR
jgi:hypothetical protein